MRYARRRVSTALAAAGVAFLAFTLSAQPVSAQPNDNVGTARVPAAAVTHVQLPKLSQPPVRWTEPDGTVHEAGALTLEQAQAGGPPISTGQATMFGTPNITTVPADQLPKPTQQTTADTPPTATACWYHNWYRGWEGGAARVDGAINWCGDGTWVRYHDGGQCWGQAWWPTHNYEGCKKDVAFGVGWNVVDLRVDWTMCVAYVPVGGYCGWKITVWDKYRYTGGGGIFHLDGS